MARSSKIVKPVSSAQSLASIIKSTRDIMRKDKGLNGDLDRLPMLTWVMFLKFLDDMEKEREIEATMAGKRFRPAVEAPYRWRDWAAREDGITGDELIVFINQDEAVRPDGTKGPGLFAYLRNLQSSNGGDRRDTIARVFSGVINRMVSGYLLRDVINNINGIHFTSSDEIHTLGHLYESMLREMRDAAGDSGEFYTPRPVVRFMVAVTDPRLGETVLDPACGTGGFLVEAFNHLQPQCRSVEHHRTLQQKTILGGEAKPMPYLLAQMNLLLHGLEYPQIDYGNSLTVPLKEIGDKDRVDVILTNPPFGGEEERGILETFPTTSRPQRPPCYSCSSSCANYGGRPSRAGPGWSCPMARSLGMGSAPGLRKTCSRTSTSIPSCACPMGSLLPIPTFPPTCCFSTAPAPPRKSGIMGSPCPRAARTTPKLGPCSLRNFPIAWPGGATGKRTTGPGGLRWRMCSGMMRAARCFPSIWTSKIPMPVLIWNTCHRKSWWRIS